MANQVTLADLQYQWFYDNTAGGISSAVTGSQDTVEDVDSGVANGYISVQFAGTFSMVHTFEQSNDNSTWDALYLQRVDAGPGGAWVNTATDATGTIYAGPVQAKYVRVRCSTDTSGTALLYIKLGGAPVLANGNVPIVGAITSVGDSATSITVLAANTSRKGAAFYNISTAILYLNLAGGTAIAATASSVAIAGSGGYFELPQPCYTGLVTGIWASDAGGVVNVTEWS